MAPKLEAKTDQMMRTPHAAAVWVYGLVAAVAMSVRNGGTHTMLVKDIT